MSEIKNAVRPFCISIDYDDTFTSCPDTWTKVINVLREAGASVVCVTFRGVDTPVPDFPGDVYYTGGRPKAEYMHEHGVEVNIWVDDSPELIGESPERRMIRQMVGRNV